MKKSAKQTTLLQKFGFAAKIVIAVEVAGFVGTYFIWRKINRDRDFRYQIYQHSPSTLNYFYLFGEKIGGKSTRQEDYTAWGVSEA